MKASLITRTVCSDFYKQVSSTRPKYFLKKTTCKVFISVKFHLVKVSFFFILPVILRGRTQ